MTPQEALKTAVSSVGSQAALAKLLSEKTGSPYRQGNVWYWLNKAQHIPAHVAVPIEEVTEGAVSRHELRPDVFGPKPTEAA